MNNIDKYDINEEDNVPREIYGIPSYMQVQNKYDINQKDNIPQILYGIPPIKIVEVNDEMKSKTNSDSTLTCPYCGSEELWTYLYGEPTYDYDKDKYVLGGCEINLYNPKYKCKKCGKDI